MTAVDAAEAPVAFAVGARTLPGILHPPRAGGMLDGVGVVVLPGGLVGRSGLHRLYTLVARRLAALGASALRFDPPGVGEGPEEPRAATSAGLASLDAPYEAEAGGALDLLAARMSGAWMVLLGHCTGARSAILTAAGDRRVRAVIAWSMPFGSDGGGGCPDWLEGAVRRLIERRVPILWVYGTRAPAYPEFEAVLPAVASGGLPETWSVHRVASANHDFTSVAWTREVIEASSRWLAARRAEAAGGRAWISG